MKVDDKRITNRAMALQHKLRQMENENAKMRADLANVVEDSARRDSKLMRLVRELRAESEKKEKAR